MPIVVYDQLNSGEISTEQDTTRGQWCNKKLEKVRETSSLRTDKGTEQQM